MKLLGIDTSNYTTSCAWLDTAQGILLQQKQLLPVPKGQAGLRQSDAVFHHTRQLPALMEALAADGAAFPPDAIGVSTAPRAIAGSYMPCFLTGFGTARALATALRCPLHTTSHQIGHVLAALYAANCLDWLSPKHAPFLAFHVSGGTTDCVLCTPQAERCLTLTPVSGSLDLKAGQAIDRVGLLLGLSFPCGPALEALAESSTSTKHAPVRLKDGSCSLSGLENQCRALLSQGAPPCDVANYCLQTIAAVLSAMTVSAVERFPQAAVLYAGGVMSNRMLQQTLSRLPVQTAFAKPAFSSDNAAGLAVYAAFAQADPLLFPQNDFAGTGAIEGT